MDLLKSAVKKNELIIKKTKKSKYVDPNTINILEKFIIQKKLICYGGIAINNILPKTEQFYDYDIDIPDYDFFSPNALEDAKELCDIYSKEKVYHVESKSAFFFGTYKVFVNFIPIADITQIHIDFYNSLLKEAIIVDKIRYTPPNFLRMSLHQELSRPLGDVSRWEKIYNRMNILNKYYPIKKENIKTNIVTIIEEKYNNIMNELNSLFLNNNVLYCNLNLIKCIYKKYFPSNLKNDFICNKNILSLLNEEPFIILHENISIIIKQIQELKIENLYIKPINTIYKFLKNYTEIYIDETYIGTVFELDSCMSYYSLTIRKQNINIGNIDTLCYLYFTLLLIQQNTINKNLVKLNIYYLYSILLKYNKLQIKYINDENNNKRITRFNLPCMGYQDDYQKILKIRYKKFISLKNNKQSTNYKNWFFKYVPKLKNKIKLSKTQKHFSKNKLNKSLKKKTRQDKSNE